MENTPFKYGQFAQLKWKIRFVNTENALGKNGKSAQ
jgi:hypothetical protein